MPLNLSISMFSESIGNAGKHRCHPYANARFLRKGCFPMVSKMSPFLFWCFERFFVTSIRLQRFTKSLLPRMVPATARSKAGMIRSLINSILIFFIGVYPSYSGFTVSIIPENAKKMGK